MPAGHDADPGRFRFAARVTERCRTGAEDLYGRIAVMPRANAALRAALERPVVPEVRDAAETMPEGVALGSDAPDDAAPPSGVPRAPLRVAGVGASMTVLGAHPRPAAPAVPRLPFRHGDGVTGGADGLWDRQHEEPFRDCPRG